jgi:hypothetical protein
MTLKYDELIKLNGIKLDKHYIQSLSKEQRLELIDPIFQILRTNGWIYPDDLPKIKKEWQKLLDYQPDLNNINQFNNSSLATAICKHFCHNFYLATEKDKPTLIDNFNNDEILKKIIFNRLGLGWLDADERGGGVNEAFNLSFKMVAIQGQRSMRLVNATSMFKPSIAKYLAMKYSEENDTIFDYSCGFGGRLLGAMSCNRKYIGTDPLTTEELEVMAEFFNFDKSRYTLIKSGSENYRGEENSIDFSYSSPAYYNQEVYSADSTQAYFHGEDYFYNTYWKNTLNNVKYMLKPGKWFGLNVKNYPKMVEMAQEVFGEIVELVNLRTVKSHLTKVADQSSEKLEYVYMFKNNK